MNDTVATATSHRTPPAVLGGPAPTRSWRGLAVLLSAQGCALTANRMGLVAIPWLMLPAPAAPPPPG